LAGDALVLNLMRCLVLELGANVNQIEDHSDLTALIWVVTIGDVEIVRCLVTELGANINQASHDGRTPLYCAVSNPYEGDHLEVVRCLVNELGAEVNQRDENGITLLTCAARNGLVDLMHCMPGDRARC
jgi:ankyrin repeat protein